MPTRLKLYIAGLVAFSALALAVTSLFLFPIRPEIALKLDAVDHVSDAETFVGILFWMAATFVASALPVQMPRGILVTVSIAPIIAATTLGGPTAGAWVALIGTTELRELRGRIPWYGSLAN